MLDKTNLNKILIIDDEYPILNLTTKILSRQGYSVDTAETGEKGIEKINSNNYALVITDIKMPGLSGDQILTDIKSGEKNKFIPVIGMSGTPWLLEGKGFDGTLSKPFSIKALLEMINQLIQD